MAASPDLREVTIALHNEAAVVDKAVMRGFDAEVREAELETGGAAFHRKAPLVEHFGYFKPMHVSLYDQLSAKDRRSGKEFEYLNAAGTWCQLAHAGLLRLKDEGTAPKTPADYAKHLYAITACVEGTIEVLRARMDYFSNVVEYGPAEAKMLAELMEQRSSPTMSAAMAELKVTLSEKRTSEMTKILAKAQAEAAVRSSTQGGGSSTTAAPRAAQ
jgi:hypothetical protein